MSTPATTAAGKAAARAAGAQRTLVGLIGLLSLAAGAAALVVGSSLLGAGRAARSVLDPIALDTLRTHQTLARGVAIASGVVLLILGLLWAARAVKPERRPNLLLDPSPDSWLEVNASAIADALRADAETVTGVNRARARMVGTTATPVLRLDLWLEDGADVRDVYRDLDTGVLTRARESLGVESLATAIRIELDAAAPARVS
ncbi:MAG: alkaline shock response membrane anchor protein AmaP [Pseudonocardiaceae bacterium]